MPQTIKMNIHSENTAYANCAAPLAAILALFCLLTVSGCSIQPDTPAWEECVFMPDIKLWEGTPHNSSYPHSFYKFGEENKMKFLVLIQGDCSFCLSKIKTWEEYFHTYRKEYENVAYAVVIYTDDVVLLKYNLEKMNTSLPAYIDTMNSFEQSNNIVVDPHFFALLDHNNKVLYSTLDNEEKMKRSHKKIMKILAQ